MPKREASATGTLTAREAQEKVAGLITETDESRQAEPPAPDDAASPAAPSETPPALTPPAPAATEPPTDEPSDTYEVTVDGETLQVDLDELRAGYSKHEDYKRKTMALAEERKSFEAESQAVQAERAQYAEGLKQVREALEALQGEPDWAERRKVLSAEDFLKEKADWELAKAQTDRLKATERGVREQQAAEVAKQQQVHLRAEYDKLLTHFPDWADTDKAKAEWGKLRAQAKTYGFKDQELDLAMPTDHRIVLLLRDALKYKELQREPNASAKAKTPAIRTARPGAAPPPPPANSQKEKLIERASQTGRMRDAVKVVEALLE